VGEKLREVRLEFAQSAGVKGVGVPGQPRAQTVAARQTENRRGCAQTGLFEQDASQKRDGGCAFTGFQRVDLVENHNHPRDRSPDKGQELDFDLGDRRIRRDAEERCVALR
jgi:hypothetical protein